MGEELKFVPISGIRWGSEVYVTGDMVEIHLKPTYIEGGPKMVKLDGPVRVGRIEKVDGDKIVLDCSKDYQSDIRWIAIDDMEYIINKAYGRR